LGEVIGVGVNDPGNVAVVEERIHYIDAYGYERHREGIIIDDAANAYGNIAVVEERLQYAEAETGKERYILGTLV